MAKLSERSLRQDGCFKIDKPMRPDQWLATDVIASSEGDVTLSLTREELEGRPEGIEHLGFHVHRRT